MPAFRFKNVAIESFALHLPDTQISSSELEDRIAPLYQRLGIPFGTLEKLSGVKNRRLWNASGAPSEFASIAARNALDQVGFNRSEIKALISCSVTRDYFEPATSCLVHRNLGLSEDSIAFDITNACIGFSNGIQMLGSMIEAGIVKAGVIVSAENVSRMVDATMDLVVKQKDTINRDELIKLLPTFTLGCGAVAMVLCHTSLATKSHRVLGSVARSASQHADLCVGNADFCIFQDFALEPIMHTEAQLLIQSAAKLGGRTWKEASEFFGWTSEDVDHVYCHQVGKQVNNAFYKEVGLDINKEFTVYPQLGNLVSAALPSALITGAAEKGMREGDKVILLGYGSGLNSIFTAISW